ncbi:MAG: hypothetical protein LBD20_05925 [Spirochaetaceae bacterium]|jgi:hypothetical protein|nr:hypothetical protein [Spirochaetaceae bacterium]
MRTGGILAAGAFIISFILGLISGAAFFLIMLRALVFAALFFGIGFGLNYLTKNMLSFSDTGSSGRIVDISVGDGMVMQGSEASAGESALNGTGDATPDDGSIDDISILFNGEDTADAASATSDFMESTPNITDKAPPISEDTMLDNGGLAQNGDYSYNKTGSIINPAGSESAPPQVAKTDEINGVGTDFNNFIPGMPGVNSVFPQSTGDNSEDESGGGEGKITVGTVEMSVEKPKQEVDLGKYKDGKKMAGAIQTMLKKDKE